MPKHSKRGAESKANDLRLESAKVPKPTPGSTKGSSAAEKTVPGPPPDSSDSDDDEGSDDDGGITLTDVHGNESGQDCDEDSNEPLEVTFAFKDPTTDHFGAIRTMLRNFPCLEGQSAADLCDFIADQAQLGTVVAQEGGWENDVFAFASVFHMGSHRVPPLTFVEELRTQLLSKCSESSKTFFQDLLRGKKSAGLGFLVKEQLVRNLCLCCIVSHLIHQLPCLLQVNLPPQLSPAMHESLLSDIGWYSEEAEGDFEEKDSKFEQILFLASFTDTSAVGDEKKSAASSSTSGGMKVPSSILFDRFDDEILAGKCSWYFQFENQFVGLISIDKYRESVVQMKKLFL